MIAKKVVSFIIFLGFLVCVRFLVVICGPDERSKIIQSIFFMSFSASVCLCLPLLPSLRLPQLVFV
jgi:hypothetical protein